MPVSSEAVEADSEEVPDIQPRKPCESKEYTVLAGFLKGSYHSGKSVVGNGGYQRLVAAYSLVYHLIRGVSYHVHRLFLIYLSPV